MRIDFIKLVNLSNYGALLMKPPNTKIFNGVVQEFSLKKYEAALFVAILGRNYKENFSTSLRDIKDEFGANDIVYIRMLKDLNELYKKGLVTIEKGRGGNTLSNPVVEIDENIFSFLLTGEDPFEGYDFNDLYSLIDLYSNLLEKLSGEKISHDRFQSEVNRMIKKIGNDLVDLKRVTSLYSEKEMLMFFHAMKDFLLGGDGVRMSSFSDEVFKDVCTKARYNRLIAEERLSILNNKVLVLDDNGFLMNDPEFMLSDKTIKLFFSNSVKARPKDGFKSKRLNYLPYKKLKKNLFLGEELQKRLQLFENSVYAKNYSKIIKRMRKSGFPEGVTALFHGVPGTGKTASAYNIAFNSKRDILQVDISSVRDKWVGNSEKNISEIFTEYDRAVDELKRAPILLFNEADALISQRINVDNSVDQMNNTMQNILLEKLESFKGIFIGTTNLLRNMDEAFSRRFLFKIEFENPDSEARKLIWLDKIPDLYESEAEKLSGFDLSGAQIENIARKYTLHFILHDKRIDISELEETAVQEMSFKKSSIGNGIGFTA